MKQCTVTIINLLGLHARASAKFVATASKYVSHIEVKKHTQVINGKSIMGVMMLSASKGTELILTTEGPDEEAMMTALIELINDCFGEAE